MANKIMNVMFFKNNEDRDVCVSYLKLDENVYDLYTGDKYAAFISHWNYPCDTLEKIASDNPNMYFKCSYATQFIGDDYNGNITNNNGVLDEQEIKKNYIKRFQDRIWNYEPNPFGDD